MAAVDDPEAGLTAGELVAIVDEETNAVVGSARRADMRKQRLPHRATYVFVKDARGRLAVQKRTMIKDYCPGYLDPAAGGVVQAGEKYDDNARREVAEEMGVELPEPAAPTGESDEDCKGSEGLEFMFTFYWSGEGTKVRF